ncbi:MAG: hypothetical protein FJZ92_13345 [Chloroflexi bacterium]|nr:hypothetical protein [Chloroflexota bacterium]
MSATITHHPHAASALALPQHLVRWEPSVAPVLSVYVDWCVSGRGLHEAAVLLRKQLHAAEQIALPHGEVARSLRDDIERVREYLAEGLDRSTRGVAIFANHARGLWRTQTLRVPLPTCVHVGDYPALLPLAEVLQDDTPCLVALADTTQLRLITVRPSDVAQDAQVAMDTWGSARAGSRSGWRRGHVQHAQATQLQCFASAAADAIGEALARARIHDLVIAGDQVIAPALEAALDGEARAALRFHTSIDIRTPVEEVVKRVWPAVVLEAREERAAEVDAMLAAAGGSAALSSDPAAIRERLAAGLVDTIAFDPSVIAPEAAEYLLRTALARGTHPIIARDHEALAAAGGVVARYRTAG